MNPSKIQQHDASPWWSSDLHRLFTFAFPPLHSVKASAPAMWSRMEMSVDKLMGNKGRWVFFMFQNLFFFNASGAYLAFDKAQLHLRQILVFPIVWLLLPWLLSGDNTRAREATNLMPQISCRAAAKLGKAGAAKQSDCEGVRSWLPFFLTGFRLSRGFRSHMGAPNVGAD